VNVFDSIARANPAYLESLYRQFQDDPGSVDEQWRLLFAGYDFARTRGGSPADGGEPAFGISDLVHSYRELGHLIADLDPLDRALRTHPLLELGEFGLGDADLDRVLPSGSFRGLSRGPLRELVTALRETYCGTLGVEYLDIPDKEQRDWLQARMEPTRNRPKLDRGERIRLLEQLVAAETFEQFLQVKFRGQKRFSLEGGEGLIPLIDTAVEEAAALGVDELVMGMPHRGRLNVLAHILRKPYEMILAEFEGSFLPWNVQGDGDVKYHLGYSHDHETRGGHRIHLSLTANPSHLEAINPVVEGIVRAKQSYRGDAERRRVVPMLLHGDAAFMGQGSVYETLAMSRLPGFATGGTIHVIVNNQIGFTTVPEDYRFTRYPSDPARMIAAPVFHVNADDPEAAVQAARLAVDFRQRFGGDVFIDFIGYRRHGHNELDDPTFTQPTLYAKIHSHPSVAELYRRRLVEEEVIDDARAQEMRESVRASLDAALASARERMPRQKVFALGGVWEGLSWAGDDWRAKTAVDAERLRGIADALRRLPSGFTPHKRARKLLDDRHDMVARGEGIDWGCAEALAYGTLLVEGVAVRLNGQDAQRGTFSHRHAVLYDATEGSAYVPLNHLGSGQAEFEVVNSLLSEVGALGFEYGMSSADPRRLVVWEAQFGDFVNGAQVIIDQFIASAESKWQRMSGLTLLLPHGYEGQGPEHSSARLERFLQLCAEGNMQVVNCTTPAQFFHVLRRQMHRRFRKPLIVMSPKSLLRNPRAVSMLVDFTQGGFQPVLPDDRDGDPAGVERILLCSGKIYYALDAGRAERDWQNIALIRVEQLYPFPASDLAAAIGRYPHAADVCWVQEEPENQGAWRFVWPLIDRVLADGGRLRADGRRVHYVGRSEAASPATGSYANHQAEENALIETALRRPRAGRAGSGSARLADDAHVASDGRTITAAGTSASAEDRPVTPAHKPLAADGEPVAVHGKAAQPGGKSVPPGGKR
jgi:2-oxoglutarate dehydrogenase E1 component